MNIISIACPNCSQSLKLKQGLPVGTRVRCTGCGKPFALPARGPSRSPFVKKSPKAGGFLLGLLFGGLLMLVGTGIGLAFYFNREKEGAAEDRKAAVDPKTGAKDLGKDPDDHAKKRETTADKKPPTETVVRPNEFDPTPEPAPKTDPLLKPEPEPKPAPEPKPVEVDPLPDDKGKVNAAIQRGVEGLRALQQGNGSWPGPHEGITALAGLTLLECGAPATDPAVQKAAAFVRTEVLKTKQVYSISTAIFFLDRLGDPVDVLLLEALTVRLLSGQVENGGWMYETPNVPEGEAQRLEAHYKQAKEKNPEPLKRPRTVADLAPELKLRLVQLKPLDPVIYAPIDHSNTQFATLALWVGRRYGVPVDRALARIELHYRFTQNPDGGWGYHIEHNQPDWVTTPSMTCAGVLGLSMAHGIALATGKPLDPKARPAAADPAKEASLRKALAHIAISMDKPPSVRKVAAPTLKGNDIYYMWSLERIMVVLKLERLSGKDWYQWGSEILLANQQSDGRWGAGYAVNGADTCFALLFLKRANLAKDLTVRINKLELIEEDKPKK